MVLKIISPEKVLYKGEACAVKLPGAAGQFTILDHHAPIVSALTAGKLIYRDAAGERVMEIKGGVAEVRDNNVVVCIN